MTKRILVIEENPFMRFALTRVSLGANVEVVYLPLQEALIAEGSYAAVLTDDLALTAPGDQIPLTVLKKQHNAPVILMTSSSNRRLEGFARQSGAAAVLFKPFSMVDLRKQLWKLAGLEETKEAANPGQTLVEAAKPNFTPADFGGRIAGDQVFDELFSELERRQPLQEGLDAFDVVERHLIKRALQTCEGNQSQAARFLGITRNTLRKRIRKYGFQSLISGDDQPDDNEP